MTHEEVMKLALVKHPETGSVSAYRDSSRLINPEPVIVNFGSEQGDFINLLSASALLYHANYHAMGLMQDHIDKLEELGLDDVAYRFIQMISVLENSRQAALIGIDKLADRKNNN